MIHGCVSGNSATEKNLWRLYSQCAKWSSQICHPHLSRAINTKDWYSVLLRIPFTRPQTNFFLFYKRQSHFLFRRSASSFHQQARSPVDESYVSRCTPIPTSLQRIATALPSMILVKSWTSLHRAVHDEVLLVLLAVVVMNSHILMSRDDAWTRVGNIMLSGVTVLY